MSKFKDKVKEIALQTGGSHYPNVNPDLHNVMVKLVVEECCRALTPELRDMISRGQGTELIKKHFGIE